MSSRAAFARDLTLDRTVYAAIGSNKSPLITKTVLAVVRSLRFRYVQRRDDMFFGTRKLNQKFNQCSRFARRSSALRSAASFTRKPIRG